eukprot:UN21839
MRVSSTVDGDTESSQRSRHSSRSSPRRDDASDDEQNFKRKWGRRSPAAMDACKVLNKDGGLVAALLMSNALLMRFVLLVIVYVSESGG